MYKKMYKKMYKILVMLILILNIYSSIFCCYANSNGKLSKPLNDDMIPLTPDIDPAPAPAPDPAPDPVPDNPSEPTSDGRGGSINSGSPNYNDTNYKPKVDLGVTAKGVIAGVLGMLKTVGIILIVVSISLIGYNTILGSAQEKALAQEKFVGLFVAASVITSGAVLAEAIAKIAETL